MKWFLGFAAICSVALGQQPPAAPAEPSAAEKEELGHALSEAGKSEIETLRVIEKYLALPQYSAFRPGLEARALLAAVALKDDALVVFYGEKVVVYQPLDIPTLTHLSHSLLAMNSRDTAERALIYARRTEDLVRQAQKGENPNNVSPSDYRNQTDRALAHALTDDARASGILGRLDEALATAQRAFEIYPDANSAREIAFWFDRLGKPMEAVRALADAFTIPDDQATGAERANDRARMGELYHKADGPKPDLGHITLEAYDRTTALLEARDRRIHGKEPNFGRTDPMEFTLSSVDGKKLDMASLKGKVVVIDIWATWCAPCRAQHPLYEKVKERFRDNPTVVFLSINADSEHEGVKSFLQALKWQGPVYYEDGLTSVFAIDSLPVTIILDRRGQLFTRKDGYVEQTFVELLTERIRGALAVAAN
jgi:thiol-disulfide isomerase/thioredoxin